MRIILTGFEPFGGEATNPSEQVVRALTAERIAGIQLLGMVLPVVYAVAEPLLAEAIDDLHPDVVLSLGQAGGRTALSIERVAINLRLTGSSDPAITQSPVSGRFQTAGKRGDRVLQEAPVVPDGPSAYFTTLPIWSLLNELQAREIPASQSFAAGTHLCNSIMYYTLHHIEKHEIQGHDSLQQTRSGFLHLPFLPEQAVHLARPGRELPPTMALANMVAAVRTTIKLLAGEE